MTSAYCFSRFQKRFSEYKIDREIKPVIVDTVELMEMQSQDKVFYDEIMKGIELWGGKDGID